MNTYKHSPNSIFLMELLLNLLLFSALLIIGLQFFMKAHILTRDTTELHHAVTLCGNVASIYESKDNLASVLNVSQHFPYCTNMKEQIFIYFDQNFEECKKDNSAYYILVSPGSKAAQTLLSSAEISFFSNDDRIIYSLTAYTYQPLTPSLKEVPV